MNKPRLPKARRCVRRGATSVEMALVLPVLLVVVIGLCIAQLGVFRYHQVAALAQESARWASVHGEEYSKQTNQPIASAASILENVIRPRAAGLELDKLTLDVQWNATFTSVTVTVRYQWIPQALFASQTLSCTAIALATY